MYSFVREQSLSMNVNHELNYKRGGCSIFHVVSTNISTTRIFNNTVRF
jgi:hypothetical protein